MRLPDHLAQGLHVVFVGNAATEGGQPRQRYFGGAGNIFWLLLHEIGLTPARLTPEDDHTLPAYGIGLTDLYATLTRHNGRVVRVDYELEELLAKLRRYRPGAVAFVSKDAATNFARAARLRLPKGYGPAPWQVGGRPAFVLPGPSGANNAMPIPMRAAMWRDLADHLELAERS